MPIPSTSTPVSGRSRGQSFAIAALGVAISLGVLFVILRRMDLTKAMDQLRAVGIGGYCLMAAIHLVSHLLRGLRLVFLAGGVQSLRLFPAIRVVLAGYALNNLAPLRLGEVAKAAGLARFSGRSLPQGLSLVALERIYDGVALVIFLSVALSFLPDAPAGGPLDRIHAATRWVGLFFFAGGLGLMGVVLCQRTLRRWLASRPPSRLFQAMSHVLEMLVTASQPAILARVALVTAGIWLIETTVFWVGLSVLHLDPGLHAAVLCLGLTCLGIALPSAPGGFGVYEASVAVALVLLGKTDQQGYTLGFAVHAAQWVADTFLGLCFLPGLGIAFFRRGNLSSPTDGAEAPRIL